MVRQSGREPEDREDEPADADAAEAPSEEETSSLERAGEDVAEAVEREQP